MTVDAGRLLEARDVTQRYRLRGSGARREILALDGVSMTIAPGETVGIVGESGSGKTTLARLLLGIEKPTQGSVLFRRLALTELDAAGRRDYRHTVAAVFQNPYSSLDPRMRIWQLITEQLFIERAGAVAQRRRRAVELLERVGLNSAFQDRYPHQLSGGQRQRVAIARALVSNPELIVLDEATSALDVSIQAQIINLLLDLQEALGVAYVFIAHNLALVRHLCHRIIVMCYGRILEEGPAAAIFSRPAHPYTDALLAASSLSHAQMERWDERADTSRAESASTGCVYRHRCQFATDLCRDQDPPRVQVAGGHRALCHYPLLAHRVPRAVGDEGHPATSPIP
jgi:oligopeptide/dipeptide ABC transporter ATP-binding protein